MPANHALLRSVLRLTTLLAGSTLATASSAHVSPPPILAVRVCLSFDEGQPSFDALGSRAWQRFTEITRLTDHRPLALSIALQSAKRGALQLDDGQGPAQAHRLWTARTQLLVRELASAHPAWTGASLGLEVTELRDYAGSRCDSSIAALFPLEAKPQICPDVAGPTCRVTCDGIACERR